MKNKKKDGKARDRSSIHHDSPEGKRRRRLEPVRKDKYRLHPNNLLDEEDDDLLEDLSENDE